jgi:hypothetical protein
MHSKGNAIAIEGLLKMVLENMHRGSELIWETTVCRRNNFTGYLNKLISIISTVSVEICHCFYFVET